MKKVMLITLIALMSCMLIVPSLAVDFDVPLEYVKHASYDEVRPGIICGQDTEKINTPSLASGTTEAIFWGWVGSAEADITGFSYSINGGEKKTDAAFKHATEEPVIAAAAGNGCEYASRFLIPVPVSEGTRLVRIYADFADGTSEVFWISEVTVGEASDYEDGAGGGTDPAPTDKPDPSDPTATPTKKPDTNPPKTGDSDVIFVIAAAGIVLTILFKKKVSV